MTSRTADTPPPASNDAPYNFVPLCRDVLEPEWAPLISHDLPMQAGVSGEFVLTLTAETPLLVGGKQVKSTSERPGEVYFFESPDGYAIPGSSLRGMIRNVFEIATFSKLSMVDDTRFGIRDISSRLVKQSYRDLFMNPGSATRRERSTGFLALGPNGEPVITPCKMARLHKNDIATWLSYETASFFSHGQTVAEKYAHYQEHVRLQGRGDWRTLRFDLPPGEAIVTRLGTGRLSGFPVFTGQISDDKKKDFVFYAEDDDATFTVSKECDQAWGDFLFIHGDDDDNQEMSWPGYWKEIFYAGGRVPVFYTRSRNRLQIALAFLPKLASDYSVHDTIRHAGHAHTVSEMTDMTELLFGRVSDEPENAIKSRVWFESARLESVDANSIRLGPTILNGPKASYFPHYIEQSSLDRGDGQYATYMNTPSNPRPIARGWKRYPARADVEVQAPTTDQMSNRKVQVMLNPLDAGVRFSSRVVFHNLEPRELGALLWAVSFGHDTGCRHGLGMGKPFGLGQVKLEIMEGSFKAEVNDPDSDFGGYTQQEFTAHFENYMNSRLEGASFDQTSQIRSLKAMADPSSPARRFAGDFRHMTLDMRNNKFLRAKQQGGVLQNILGEAKVTPVSISPAPELEQPQAEAAGPASAEQMLAELEAMFLDAEKQNDKRPHGPMVKQRMVLLKAAQEWDSPELQKAAAELIRRTVRFRPWSKKTKADCNKLLANLE